MLLTKEAAFAVSKLLQVEGDVSDIARYVLLRAPTIPRLSDGQVASVYRQGSGSATRSLYGGFVAWEMGTKDDGSDSIAVQVSSLVVLPPSTGLIYG